VLDSIDIAYQPPLGFYFTVRLLDANSDKTKYSKKEDQYTFQEVKGISIENKYETVMEGGVNRFQHKLPTGFIYTDLELKRGLVPQDSAFLKWCLDTVEQGLDKPIEPKTIVVSLLNPNVALKLSETDPGRMPKTLISWVFMNAYPVKWSVAGINSQKSDVVIESLTMCYQYFKVQR